VIEDDKQIRAWGFLRLEVAGRWNEMSKWFSWQISTIGTVGSYGIERLVGGLKIGDNL
jgi:hypothetical protein